jgi:hypothetical protein
MDLRPVSELDPEDIAVLKALELHKGVDAAPEFRSYTPLHVPWFLTADQVRFMTLALHSINTVAENILAGKVERPAKGTAICIVPEPLKGRQIKMGLYDMKLPHYRPPVRLITLDRARIDEVLRVSTKGSAWETGITVLPSPIADREIPYYLRVALVIDASSGYMFEPKMILPEESNPTQCIADVLLSVMISERHLPSAIHVRGQEQMKQLKPLADALGIKVVCPPSIPAFDNAVKEMKDAMSGRKRKGPSRGLLH